jgi:hypothetical protein
MVDPTNCNRCNASLERGWSERYKGNELIESICFSCSDKENIEQYEKTEILTLKITMCAKMDEIHRKYGEPLKLKSNILNKILTSCQNIENEIKLWERDVWFNHLQSKVKKAEFRGWRLDFNGGYVLVYSIAGRTQFTIESENNKYQISLLTREDSTDPVMGLNSINATEAQAIKLLVDSRKAFTEYGASFERNNDVNLGF